MSESVNNIINKFEKLSTNNISKKDYKNIKPNLQKITKKLTEIINAIAGQKGATFTPEQKRGLISALVKSISNDYIVLPEKAKTNMLNTNGNLTKKLIEKIKSKIKDYINICTLLKKKDFALGSINNTDDFISNIQESINTDFLKIKLKTFLGVTKEDKMEKLIELITSNNKNNKSEGTSLIFTLVTRMAQINKTTNNSNTLYYDIISNQFISDICELIDLCTVTKKSNSGTIVNVEYIIDDNTSIAGNGALILHIENQEKLNKIIQKVVNYRTQVTES